jgi:hypothetical protein
MEEVKEQVMTDSGMEFHLISISAQKREHAINIHNPCNKVEDENK